jgi:hypothetical protein
MKLTAFILAALLSTPVMASDRCTMVAELAEVTMELRQQNTPITELLKHPNTSEFSRDIAILAYKQPLGKTDTQKRSAVVEFGLVFLEVCLNAEKEEGIML